MSLDAVARLRPSLKAFFGVMYSAALRPGEAVDLRKEALTLPRSGWGELYLSTSAPAAGRAWSEGGTRREPRQLKHRAVDEVRSVPCPPAGADGAVAHAPDRARHRARLPAVPRHPRRPARRECLRPYLGPGSGCGLSPVEFASPLARRPYDLRHAAVSTWLNGGVPAPQVAQWAGHSVDVLLRVSAKCIAGQEAAARRRVEEALR
jgi:integrase